MILARGRSKNAVCHGRDSSRFHHLGAKAGTLGTSFPAKSKEPPVGVSKAERQRFYESK